MKLENNFTIDAPVEKAWQALNNPETVAPCFPGATLTSYEGDSFAGTVKVKLGPIAMTYKGKGTYVSRDEAAHEVVIEANGRDSRGNGTANATVTALAGGRGGRQDGRLHGHGHDDHREAGAVRARGDRGRRRQDHRAVRGVRGAQARAGCGGGRARPVSAAASEATSDIPTPPPGRPGARRPRPRAPRRSRTRYRSGCRRTGHGASPAPGASAVDAPVSADVSPAAATGTPVTPGAGTSEVEAPVSADMTPAPATGPPAAPGTGTSEVEAPVAADVGSRPRDDGPGDDPGGQAARHEAARTAGGTGLRAPVRSEVDAIDLLDHAGASVLQRLVPVLGGGLLLVLIVLLVRRLRAG